MLSYETANVIAISKSCWFAFFKVMCTWCVHDVEAEQKHKDELVSADNSVNWYFIFVYFEISVFQTSTCFLQIQITQSFFFFFFQKLRTTGSSVLSTFLEQNCGRTCNSKTLYPCWHSCCTNAPCYLWYKLQIWHLILRQPMWVHRGS